MIFLFANTLNRNINVSFVYSNGVANTDDKYVFWLCVSGYPGDTNTTNSSITIQCPDKDVEVRFQVRSYAREFVFTNQDKKVNNNSIVIVMTQIPSDSLNISIQSELFNISIRNETALCRQFVGVGSNIMWQKSGCSGVLNLQVVPVSKYSSYQQTNFTLQGNKKAINLVDYLRKK